MNFGVAIVLGSIAAVVLTILMYVKILPRKMDGTFEKPFYQFLHDFFHFKKLYLEEVLKAIFTLATVACVVIGALLLISTYETWGYYDTYRESTAPYGLLILIGGPIALRLVYESMMMFILLVKNTMEINNKLKGEKKEETPVQEAPAQETPAQEEVPAE